MTRFTSILLLAIAMISQVKTWHDVGHMLVAKVASNVLAKESPVTLAVANQYLGYLSNIADEHTEPFVESATYMDKINTNDVKNYKKWHFQSNFWTDEPDTSLDHLKITGPAPVIDAVKQIQDAVDTLQAQPKNIEEYPYTQYDPRIEKSLAIRRQIHLVGDIHQPLHGSERVDKDNLDGDFGGNACTVNYPQPSGSEEPTEERNLHFVWDHVFYHYDPDHKNREVATSPYGEGDQEKLADWAEEIMTKFPKWWRTPIPYSYYEVQDWANESQAFAKTYVYNDQGNRIQTGSTLSQEYIESSRDLAMERIAWAGYRLAEALKSALETPFPAQDPENLKIHDTNTQYIQRASRMLKID